MNNFLSASISLITSIALAILFQTGIETQDGGYWIVIFVATSLLVWVGLVSYAKKRLKADVYILALAILGISLSYFIRAGDFAIFIRSFLIFYGYILLAEATHNGKISYTIWKGIIPTIFFAPIRFLTALGPVITSVKWGRMKGGFQEKSQNIIDEWGVGVLISIPFLIVFTALLAQINPIFGDLINLQWIIDLLSNIPNRVAPIVFYTWIFWGAYLYMTHLESKEVKSLLTIESPIANSSAISRALFLVVLLFGIYLIIDLPYLFGGYDAFLTVDRATTLSEYAMQGFYETLLVLIVSGIFIITTQIASIGESLSKNGRIIYGVLIAQLVLFVYSAWLRLSIYISEYGWTETRLLGLYTLVLFLGAIIVMSLYRYKNWKWQMLERVGVLLVYIWCVSISLLPSEAIAWRLHVNWVSINEESIEVLSPRENPAISITNIALIESERTSTIEVVRNGNIESANFPDVVACRTESFKRTIDGGGDIYNSYNRSRDEVLNMNLERNRAERMIKQFDFIERDCNEFGY